MRFLIVILLIGINISCTTSKKEDAANETATKQYSKDSATAISLNTAPPQSVQRVDTTNFGKFMELFDSPGSEIPEDCSDCFIHHH